MKRGRHGLTLTRSASPASADRLNRRRPIERLAIGAGGYRWPIEARVEPGLKSAPRPR
jgi:hypothetical protein